MTRTITLAVKVQEHLPHGHQISYRITTEPPVPEGVSSITTHIVADLVACVEARKANGAGGEGV